MPWGPIREVQNQPVGDARKKESAVAIASSVATRIAAAARRIQTCRNRDVVEKALADARR